MITEFDNIIFYSNKYRRQYFRPYESIFNNSSYSLLRLFDNRYKLITSDFPLSPIRHLFKFFRKKHYIFLWNNIDELINKITSDKKYLKYLLNTETTFIFAFEIDNNLTDQLLKIYPKFDYQVIPPPLKFKKSTRKFKSKKIIFYGELDIERKNINHSHFEYLKKLSLKVLDGDIDYSQIENKIFNKFNGVNYNLYLWKTRNLIRYNYLDFLAKVYNTRLILIGDQLKVVNGATNIRSNYSRSFRMNLYKKYENEIFIDLLCKSTSSCLYARSQELLENVDVFLQLKSYNSKLIYKQKFKSIVFNSKENLKAVIDNKLNFRI